MSLTLINAALNGRYNRMVGGWVEDMQEDGGYHHKVATSGYTIVGGELADWSIGANFDTENFNRTLALGFFPVGLRVKRGKTTYMVECTPREYRLRKETKGE